MKTIELLEYLAKYDDDAEVFFVPVNRPYQAKYRVREVKTLKGLTPVIGLNIGDPEPYGEPFGDDVDPFAYTD